MEMNFNINMTAGICIDCKRKKYIAEGKICLDCLTKRIKKGEMKNG